jgi:hypothetical protein
LKFSWLPQDMDSCLKHAFYPQNTPFLLSPYQDVKKQM